MAQIDAADTAYYVDDAPKITDAAYDALRRERLHKGAMNHAGAVAVILKGSPSQFDPVLLKAFETWRFMPAIERAGIVLRASRM